MFTCDGACGVSTCQKTYASQKNINRHKNLKKKICPECNAEVVDLKRHERDVHMDVRLYSCTYDRCEYSAKNATALQSHVRHAHTKEKPFQCCFCDASFSCNSTRDRHEESHTDEKFVCDVCDVECNTSQILAQHKRIHLSYEEYPFECDVCQKRFAHSTTRSRHMITHQPHREPIYQCGVCNKMFMTKDGLIYCHMPLHRAPQFKCPIDGCAHPDWYTKGSFDRHMAWHAAPRCINCNGFAVESEDAECGWCRLGREGKGVRERTFFRMLCFGPDGFDANTFELRDRQIGDGVALRPDALLQAVCGDVLVVVELDEDYHKSNNMSDELKRQERIRKAYPDNRIFFVRYNPDQPDGLTEAKINEVQKWIRFVLDERFDMARASKTGYQVDYIGYPEIRVNNLKDRFRELYKIEPTHMTHVVL